jgi:type I restriction enzyme S subunit
MARTSFNQMLNLRSIFAPSQLEILDIPNKNTKPLNDLLSRPLKSSDKGMEVGSSCYISKSSHYFIRAKALQDYSFLPFWNNETKIPIIPSSYTEYNLKKGDVIISKDSNIGEVIILDKNYPNHMISGALYKLPITEYKYYILSFIKHSYFRKQLDLLVPKGSTIRHAKTMFLECKIPFPKSKNKDQVIKFIELLTKSIIEKEIAIRERSEAIFEIISKELADNQKKDNFVYKNPTLSDIKSIKRINAGIFSEYFKSQEFLIKNYKNGFSNIAKLGFNVSRGQNLQITCIGESIHSRSKKENFYTVIKPKNISIYGTAMNEEYLGNSNFLKTLKKGDIIFGAEGFEKGRSLVIFEDKEKTITNIHGITLNHETNDMNLSIFVKCFLDYLRNNNLIDLYAVGGNGGSLAMKYWAVIPIPNFPEGVKKKIICLYSQPTEFSKKISLENFEKEDERFNNSAGIRELDIALRKLKSELNNVLNNIINDQEMVPNFSFLI